MLEIEDLRFQHAGGETLYRFDIGVAPGEIVALTGPSGSGKSTLLDLVAGFLVPRSGDIRLDGRSILELAPEQRPVSILFQSDNVFDHLSAGANAALGLSPGTSANDPRVREALAGMGLPDFGSRRASTLSGGQKQRVALARTILRDRPVLLLDEPFTGLDQETIAPIREALSALVRERRWHAILVSHDSEDVAALTTRGYRMVDGQTRPA